MEKYLLASFGRNSDYIMITTEKAIPTLIAFSELPKGVKVMELLEECYTLKDYSRIYKPILVNHDTGWSATVDSVFLRVKILSDGYEYEWLSRKQEKALFIEEYIKDGEQ